MSGNNFRKDLEAGLEYQDFLTVELGKRGIFLGTLQSKQMQRTRGENLLGMEIKLDRKLASTKKVFIEVEQKKAEGWVKSGVFAPDKSWLFLIGDYSEAFIFCRKLLQLVSNKVMTTGYQGCSEVKEIGNGYARGYLMEWKTCLQWCSKYVKFEAKYEHERNAEAAVGSQASAVQREVRSEAECRVDQPRAGGL